MTLALLVVLMLGWTAALVWNLRRRPPVRRTAGWLLATVLIVLVLRVPYLAATEPNADTSTWLAAALTVRQRPEPVLTLLTHTDARPLTVLPLVLWPVPDLKLDYRSAELVGVLCWLGTLLLVYRLLRFSLPSAASVLGVWVLGLFIGTTYFFDHVAYNSEHLGVLMLTLGTLATGLVGRAARVRPGHLLLLGVLLGAFPYEKLQIVPMGLLLAGFTLWYLIRLRAWGAVAEFVAGGVLPTIAVVAVLASWGQLDVLFDAYLGHYFRYSMTQDFSNLTLAERFSPVRIILFLFRNWPSVFYLTGQCLALSIGLVLIRGTARRFQPDAPPAQGVLIGLLLLVSTYAVLQAGNNFTHYTLLLYVPLLQAVGWVVAQRPAARQFLGVLVLGTALVQGMFNLATRQSLPPSYTPQLDAHLVRVIQAHSRPGDPLVVWGYADHLHVLAHRPMGYRYANTFYVYAAYQGYLQTNLRYFLDDVRQSRPALLVDATVINRLVRNTDHKHPESFPPIAAWMRQHYELIDATGGTRVYRRKESGRYPQKTPPLARTD